jgi:hypothetical protein
VHRIKLFCLQCTIAPMMYSVSLQIKRPKEQLFESKLSIKKWYEADLDTLEATALLIQNFTSIW